VIVSGAAVENVPAHGQRLHAVLVGGVKRLAGADAPLSALRHLEHLEKTTRASYSRASWRTHRNGKRSFSVTSSLYLDLMVFGAGEDDVLPVTQLVCGQTHDGSQMAGELPSGHKSRERRERR